MFNSVHFLQIDDAYKEYCGLGYGFEGYMYKFPNH